MNIIKQLVYIPIIFLFIGASMSSFGQEDSISRIVYDTMFIKDLSDKVSLRLYGVNKFNKFGVSDHDLEHKIQYSPNSNLNLGIGVNYKWFGLGLAFNFPFVNNDNHTYGNTRRFDAQTNIFTRKLVIDIHLQYYKGFYVENPESYLDDWTPDMPYPQRSDINTSTIGGSCLYAFNYKKYSAKAAFVQTELQKKSAGSFLLGGFFSIYNVEGDSSFIPYELRDAYDPELFFYRVSVSGIGVSLGYTHTFVLWKKLYLSFTMVPGVSFQSFDVRYEDLPDKRGSFAAGRFVVRTAIVYNSDRSYFGITAINDSFNGNAGKEQQNSINYEVGVIRFFYGRRFNIN